ncbi:MAG: pentapeptide repeat-containing protein [Actinomycetota bacterium]|nr:pentapeptide repeat-containing protein [Actinomycetota bacterium]
MTNLTGVVGLTSSQLRSIQKNSNPPCGVAAGPQLALVVFGAAQLSGFDLTGAAVWADDLRGANLSSVNMHGAFLAETNFSNANLTAANFTCADLSLAILTGSVGFTSTDLRSANGLGGIVLHGLNLSGFDFSNLDLYSINDLPADFSSANASNAKFPGANLSSANFTNTNLTGASGMSTATLTGVTWNNTTCPDGTNSNNDGNTCVGHL